MQYLNGVMGAGIHRGYTWDYGNLKVALCILFGISGISAGLGYIDRFSVIRAP